MTAGDIALLVFMIVIFLAMCIAPSKLGGKSKIDVKEKPQSKSKCSCGCDKNKLA